MPNTKYRIPNTSLPSASSDSPRGYFLLHTSVSPFSTSPCLTAFPFRSPHGSAQPRPPSRTLNIASPSHLRKAKYQTPNTKCLPRRALAPPRGKYQTPNTQYQIPNTKYRPLRVLRFSARLFSSPNLREAKYQTPNTKYQPGSLTTGSLIEGSSRGASPDCCCDCQTCSCCGLPSGSSDRCCSNCRHGRRGARPNRGRRGRSRCRWDSRRTSPDTTP